MNKIEEIIDTVWNNNTDDTDYKVFYRLEVKDCMKQFGRICFEAGRQANYVAVEQYIEELLENNKLQYQTYEDFLKEIENE